jgi:general stress protein CsbA
MTNSPLLRILRPVLILSSAIFIIHLALLFLALPPVYFASKFWLIYLFLVPLTLAGIYFIQKKHLADSKSVGKNFFIYMIAKMVLTLLFLSPWLVYKDEFSRPMVYQFFAIFFPLLFMETFVLIKLLNPKPAR